MNPIAVLTLIVAFSPCIAGLLLIRWSKKGYLVTPKWLEEVDKVLLGAVPVSCGAPSGYVFPVYSGKKLLGSRILMEIIEDYRAVENRAVENWE